MKLVEIFIISLVIVCETSWARLADDVTYSNVENNCVIDKCFHQPQKECPSADSNCRCRQLPNCKYTIVCCNVNKFQLNEGLACANFTRSSHIALHIRNTNLSVLNFTDSAWRRLKYLTITDGQIESVEGEFPKHTSLSCLNLSSNGIVKFEERSLVNLYNLSFLDLSHNNLTEIPRFKKEGYVTLDISDNKPMLCYSVFDALKRSELNFTHEEQTYCLSARTFHWFNSTVLLPLSQVLGVHELREGCTKNCTCEPYRMDILPGKPPTFSVAVNCSGQSLTTLPTPLPPDTVVLNISNNNITSLKLLATDPSYQNLRILYADNNQIDSILPLEGSKFMSNFVALDLRNNKLKSIPTYMLSNIFDRNFDTRNVHLGLNRLLCDCSTAKILKDWLLTKQKQISDYDEIYCENMDVKVRDLNPSKLCQSQQDWTDYIFYIITAEILLLVGLIAKVSYDYWVFKTAGYLPWPASKMPKLPCDWLCE